MIDTSSLVVREILKKLGATDEMIRDHDPMLEKLWAEAAEYRFLTQEKVVHPKQTVAPVRRPDREDGLL